MQASIQSRLAGAMREQGMRSLLLADPENFGYVAGPMLPYVKQTPDRAVLALFEPGTDEAACTCWLYPDLAQPAEAQLAKEPSAVCVAVAEDAVGADCLIRRLKESRPDLDGVVGVDFSQTAASVFDALRAAFPGCSFKDAGPMLRGLRLVKLPEEIDRIEMACRQVDTGIIGAINHMEGAHSGSAYRKGFYTVPEFIERVRIHAYEGGTSMSGNMAAVAGEAIGANYMPQRGFLPSEGLCRIEYACCHGGYWGVTARMIHIGEDMDPRVRSACADNLSLKMLALDMLRPGVACSDIHGAVVKEAAKRGIPLSGASGIGHGVGRGEIEGPYLAADDPTVLCENMVIALDVATLGPEGESPPLHRHLCRGKGWAAPPELASELGHALHDHRVPQRPLREHAPVEDSTAIPALPATGKGTATRPPGRAGMAGFRLLMPGNGKPLPTEPRRRT